MDCQAGNDPSQGAMWPRGVRLGLLGAARITEPAIVEPARRLGAVELGGVACREASRARAAAERWSIPRAHETYAALVADEALDAIYIATPATHHRRWVLESLAHGKHVLCEKPLGANAAEAEQMTRAAADAGLILMEAFHWRYHPYVAQIRAVLNSGVIGTLRHVDAVALLPAGFFAADDIRWDLSLGGGCLMDVGCYPIQWLRWLASSEPDVVVATARCRTEQVDAEFSAQFRWPSGLTGSIECSMQHASETRVLYIRAEGTRGVLTAYNPVLPQLGASLQINLGDALWEVPVDRSSTYDHQLVAFATAVVTATPPPTSGADAVANQRLVDACYVAAGLSPRPSIG